MSIEELLVEPTKTKVRVRSTETNVKTEVINVKTKNNIQTLANETSAGCCSFISRSSSSSVKDSAIRMTMTLSRKKMPTYCDSDTFIKMWIDFINSFGYDIELRLPPRGGDSITVTLEQENKNHNYYFLFALNLIRYLWSTHYDHLPMAILKLREDKTLSHLSNWEIFQLGHKTTSLQKKHFNDMSPIDNDSPTVTNYITSDQFFKNRQFENLGSHLSTFNIKMPNEITTKVNKLINTKDYLGIYNLTSTKVNKIMEVSKAKCIDNNNFESELNLNGMYEINRLLVNTIKIKNKNHILKLYKKDRFKLI